MEQLWERSRVGRKETNRKPSTRTGKEGMGNQAGNNGESQEAKAERRHRGSHCEAEAGMAERKKQRLSSEMLKRKRTQGSGSQALIPEERSKREAPVERLWERNWEGRKETNRKLSKQNRKEADGRPAVDEGEKRRGRKKP